MSAFKMYSYTDIIEVINPDAENDIEIDYENDAFTKEISKEEMAHVRSKKGRTTSNSKVEMRWSFKIILSMS